MPRDWTFEEELRLREMLPNCATWRELGRALGRSRDSVRHKAYRLGLEGLLGSGLGRRENPMPEETPPAISKVVSEGADGLEDWLDAVESLQQLMNRADPLITSQEVRIETDRPIALIASADWHIGSRWVSYGSFRKFFERALETPRAYWGLHGDLVDSFLPSFRHAEPVLDQVIGPKFQRRLVAFLVKRLAENGRLLYGCGGHHEGFATRAIGEDLFAEVFRKYKVPYFRGKGVLRLFVGEQRYILGVAHQWPGNSMWNLTHGAGRALRFDLPNADLILGGHRHSYACMELRHHELARESGGDVPSVTYLVSIGSPKEGPEPYSITYWSRGVFVWPIFVLYPDEHKVLKVPRWEDLAYYLELGGG